MFHGSIVALVTPMTPDRDPDFAALERLIEFHLCNGTDGIVAVGTTGESATLNYDEHCLVIREAVRMVNGRCPLIAGTGSNATREARYLTRKAMEAGADASLSVVPYYVKPSQEGMYRHFKAIAEETPLPMILYNVPGRTACDMLPDTVDRLAGISNVVGIKEASGNVGRIKELLQRCGDRIDILSGDDPLAAESMLAGAKGVISVTANAAPKAMKAMCNAALAGDEKKARELDQALQPLHQAMFVEPNPSPAKWAVAQSGLMEEYIRLPLIPLTEQGQAAVWEAMQGVAND